MGTHVTQSHCDRGGEHLPAAVRSVSIDGYDATGRLHDWPVYDAIGRLATDAVRRLVGEVMADG